MKWELSIFSCTLLTVALYATVAASTANAPAQPEEAAAGTDPVRAAILRSCEDEGNDAQLAFREAQTALDLARRRAETPLILQSLLQIAKSARAAGEYDDARKAVLEGTALAKATHSDAMRAEFGLLSGMIHWNLANLPAATADFLEARAIAETLDDDPLRIGAETGLGLAALRNDNRSDGLTHLETALHLAERTRDPRLGSILNNIGNHYLGLKEYPRAREYFERALTLSSDGRNQRIVAYILINLGEIAAETGDQAGAAKSLGEAMSICERFGIRRGLADAHYLLARVERDRGHLDESSRHLDDGMVIARKLDNPDLLISYDQEYILTKEAMGDYRQALDYARQLSEQTEKIRGERSRQQVAEIEARYDNEARTRQIKLLQRDKELQQADLELKSTELSRSQARYYALGEVVVFGAIIGAMIVARQRSRARRTGRMLAEIRAAKELIEEGAAQKAHLLRIAAQDLNESEARFRNAFNHSPLGLALVGLDGRWMRVNAALCEIVGYPENELLGTTFQAITHAEDLSADLSLLERLIRGEIETYTIDKRYIHRLGREVWIRLDVSLMRDPVSDLPRYFISQVQDITERRRSEEQLHQAKEEAEKANAAKNEFLSRMSHELRTPLNAILGFGQLLELQDLGPSQNQGVGYILTAGRHLLSLINEVLDLSRIESGRFTFCSEPTAAAHVLRQSLEMMRPLAGEAGLRLETAPESVGGMISADPRRLKQVLLNLLANAIKYNCPGGTVVVGCREGEERLRIEVSDTGVGIAADDLGRIFAPFARLSATQEIAGTGLGLSLSKALTEAMGGTIGVTSQPGVGSTFWVEFERVTGAEAMPPEIPEITLDPLLQQIWDGPTRPVRILYIEDDPANLELLARLFNRDPSLHLLTATNGRRGLEVIHSQSPDLILLDVQLPDMDGAELLTALRGDPATTQLPVVVISADAACDKIDRMRELGAQAYITKPFDFKALRQTIDEAIHAAVPI